MSILDTFYILFKTDADKAQKEIEGADKAATSLADKIDKVGKVDTSGLADVNAKLVDATASAEALNTALNQTAATPVPGAPTPTGTTPPIAPAPVATPTSGLSKALQDAGAISPIGVEKLNAALTAAKMNAKELTQEAARAKFDGRPNAGDLAEQAKKAALDAKELELAVGRARTELKNASGEAGKLDSNLDKANAHAKRLGVSFTQFVEAMAIPLIGVAAAAAAVTLGLSRIKPVADIGDQSGKLRSSAQDYDAFTRAVRASGGSIDEAKNNLIKFNDKLNDASNNAKGPAAKEFAKWGIQFRDVKGHALGAVDGIISLSKSLEKVSQADAMARLKKLGINDAATIALILQGKNAIIEKMNAEKAAGVVTDDQIRIAGEYQNELGATQNVLDSFGNKVMELVIPSVTALMRVFRDTFTWLINHRVLVEGFFIGVAAAVTAFFLPAMIAAAAAVIAATWPFLLIGAAIAAVSAAFALLYEDIVAFINGDPSEIGVLAGKYQAFAFIVRSIGEFFKELSDAATQSWAQIKEAVAIGAQAFSGAWTAIKPVLDGIIAGGEEMAGKFVAFWMSMGEGARAFFTSLDPLWATFKDAGQVVIDVFRRIFPQLEDDAARLKDVWTENFEELKTNVVNAITTLYDSAKPIFDRIAEAAGLIKDAFVSAFNAITSVWNNTIGGIVDGIQRAITAARGLLGLGGAPLPAGAGPNAGGGLAPPGPVPTTAGGIIHSTMQGLVGTPPVQPIPDSAGAQMGALMGKRAVQEATTNPLGAQTPGTIAAAGAANIDNSKTQTNTVNVGSVTVQTQATDSHGIAAGIRDGIRSELRTTISNFDDGVEK